MSNTFSAFAAGVPESVRRALLELRRLIGEKVAKAGDTMTGRLTVPSMTIEEDAPALTFHDLDDVLSNGEQSASIQFEQSDLAEPGVSARIVAEGDGTVGGLQLVLQTGLPSTIADALRVRANRDVTDGADRHFPRLGSGHAYATIIQAGNHTQTADGNSLVTVTFPEAFDAAPICVATRVSGSTAQQVVHRHSISPTQAVFRVTSNDALQPGVSNVSIDWIAVGRKAT